MEPHERLKQWISVAGITSAEAARRCGYDRSNFHRIVSGAAKPSLDLAHAIEAMTGGAIPMQSWVIAPRQDAAAA